MTELKQLPPVQYRSGRQLARWLPEQAAAWKVTENEAARLLAAFAFCRLDVGLYPLLKQLAGALAPPGSRPDFVLACNHLRTALDSADRARQDLGNQPLNEDEVLDFIKRTVRDAVSRQRSRREQERRVQKVTVKALRAR